MKLEGIKNRPLPMMMGAAPWVPPSFTSYDYIWKDGQAGATALSAANLNTEENNEAAYAVACVVSYDAYIQPIIASGGTSGLFPARIVNTAGGTNLLSTDRIVFVDTSAGGYFFINLPSITGFHDQITVKVINSNNPAVVFPTGSGVTIEGNGSYTLSQGNMATEATFVNDGSGNTWRTVKLGAPIRQPMVNMGNKSGSVTLNLINADDSLFALTNTGTGSPGVSFNVTGAHVGSTFTVVHTQDGTGSHTVNWPFGTKWSGGAPQPTTTPGAIDEYYFVVLAESLGVPSSILGHVVGTSFA